MENFFSRILYEEVNKRTFDGGKGCLGIMVLLMRIPVEKGHCSGVKKATVPTGKRPPFRQKKGHHSGAIRPV